ncbi:MAG TPA: AMP-binding protein [Candidatus Didemnitutus sp.]|nr:AMP-binding protein [Candidatus Didemnitutus sp.]
MSLDRLTTHWHRLDRNTCRALQGRKLHGYLRDCVLPFSAHYQQVFAQAGLTADDIRTLDDLQKIPFSTKDQLLPTKENPRRSLDFTLIPDPQVLARRPGVIWRALTRGRARTMDELDREWRPTFMTATTGRSTESVAFLYTQHDIANLGIGSGRIADLGGRTRDDRMLNMFPFAPHLAFWYMYYAGINNNIFALATGGGKVMGTDGNLRAIQKLRPTVLTAMPTFAYHVLTQAVEEKLRIEGLKCVLLGGEKVADGTRRKLAALCAQLGSPDVHVVATYGFTEAKLAWAECPFKPGQTPPGYHLYPDMGIFEVIDPATGNVLPDGTGGEIVWTPLVQRGTVVIRYRTGDHIENGLTHEPCPCCGRTMPRLLGKISRVSDFRSLRFQKVKGTFIDFNELEHALDDTKGIGSWQIELRKAHDDPLDLDEIHLHVTKNDGVSDDAITTVLNNLMHAQFEVRPNRIAFHSPEQMRELQKVGVALKEQRVVDNRPKGTAPPHETAAVTAELQKSKP